MFFQNNYLIQYSYSTTSGRKVKLHTDKKNNTKTNRFLVPLKILK